jgi:hypothetical protein
MDSSLLQSSDTVFPTSSYSSSYSSPYSSSNDSGFFDSFKNMNMTTWIIIIFILAFLGFNIFVYLAQGTQTIVDIFAPLMEGLFKTTAAVAGETVDIAADGAKVVVDGTKTVVDKTANVLDTGLTAIQDITPNIPDSVIKGQPISQPPVLQGDQSTLNKALNTRQMQQASQKDYQAHEASSSIHSAGRDGWCFIGEDRGFRSCAQIGVNDTCMSGDIFPTHEICMNPNLRP